MIESRYTIFIRIPLIRCSDGQYFTERLWAKDLRAHFVYLSDFHVCCPVEDAPAPPADLVHVPELSDANVLRLRRDLGWGSVLKNLLPNFLTVGSALRRTQIAHSGGAGWAFPLSYYILPLRLFLKFRWLIVIESSFWMLPRNVAWSLRGWLRHHINFALIRWCTRAADARVFTQSWYRDAFLGSTKNALVAPAIWIDEEVMISEAHLQECLERDGRFRVLFPSRLVADKGVETFLTAIELLEEMGADLSVDIIGEGPLRARCEAFVEAWSGKIPVRLLRTVPYGPEFFTLLRNFDAAVIANRQHEQPRIIYDVFSQGLTCVASRTTGVVEITNDGSDSRLFEIDDAQGLADILQELSRSPDLVAKLRREALKSAQGRTHGRMHEDRKQFLLSVFGNH